MKKFVVVMITILVLFVFLMLNYLLWDKENLQKQSEYDRIEQDWLRGQNRTLQATVNEQEQTITALEKEKTQLQNRMDNLQEELKKANSQVENYRKEISDKGQAINNYKMLTEGLLCQLTLDWFESISSRDYDAVWELLAPDHTIFGRQYNQEDFFRDLEAVHSVSLVPITDEEDDGAGRETDAKPWEAAGYQFEILRGFGNEYEVMAELMAEVTLDEDAAGEVTGWAQGSNRIRITFLFNPNDQKWAIKAVAKLSS
ncbi:MAG TPA: hypothetical protein PK369_01525 [Thermoclostridium sp.]|nr:hypothetical protein [Thermoclostridium sp.]HPU44753.1 hypothetical protein [Thermoclostridium sp.]